MFTDKMSALTGARDTLSAFRRVRRIKVISIMCCSCAAYNYLISTGIQPVIPSGGDLDSWTAPTSSWSA